MAALCCGLVWGADWLTDGGNAQRTNWQKEESIFNKDNVKNLKILWKLKLDNKPREMHSLFPPLIVDKLNTSSGPKQIAIEAGISDNLYAIDVEPEKLFGKSILNTRLSPKAAGYGKEIRFAPAAKRRRPSLAPPMLRDSGQFTQWRQTARSTRSMSQMAKT